MFITVHAAAALAATTQLTNPLLTLAVGFVSHLILDIVPHGDDVLYGRLTRRGWTKRRFGLAVGPPDTAALAVGLAAYLYLLSPAHPTAAVAAAIGAALPDVLWGLATFVSWRWLKAFDRFHERCHYLLGRCLLPMWAGFGVQALILAAAVVALLGTCR